MINQNNYYLHEGTSNSVEGSRELDHGVVGLECLKLVGSSLELVSGLLGDSFSDLLIKSDIGVQSSSHSTEKEK